MLIILLRLKTLSQNIESKVPKFKVNDRVRITKYKNILRKDYTGNWSRK